MKLESLDIHELSVNEMCQEFKELKPQRVVCNMRECWNYYLSHDYKKAGGLSQVIIDQTWEELNTGNWKDIDIAWRKIFTLASLVKSMVLCEMNKFELAVKACDMGLLMGAPIHNNILGRVASLLVASKEINGNLCTAPSKQPDNKVILSGKNIEDSSNMHMKRNLAPLEMDAKIVKKSRLELSDPVINKNHEIRSVICPSLFEFQKKYLDSDFPVILKECMIHWPACQENHRWTVNYIKKVAGNRTVPIEIGRQYTSNEWTQKLMTITQFIDSFILNKDPNGYLAQHQLFEQIPELKNDIIIPDYCYLSKSSTESEVENLQEPLVQAWFGPQGTISPLHHDPYDNLFAQITGRKYVRLYNCELSHLVYPHESGMLNNTSQVDVENVDNEKFPNFNKAYYYECILNEGDILYIPRKWWHYVRSLSVSFSVSFWW